MVCLKVTTPTKKARIVHMRMEKKSFHEIAHTLDISHQTASRIWKEYHKHKDFYYKTPRTGRPPLLGTRDIRLAGRKIRSGECTTASELQREHFPKASVWTIRRALTGIGLPGRRPRKKPLLTKIHQRKRYQWAMLHRDWTTTQWRQVCFSDEAKFNLFGSDGARWCRRGVGEEFHSRNVQKQVKYGGGHVMVWGCITAKGFGRLHRICGKMNAAVYCQILEEALLGTISDHSLNSAQIIFQQDNDPKHTSAAARKWFNAHNITVLPWAPSSPDMNIIENVWSQLDIRVHSRKVLPHNKEEMWNALLEEWQNLSIEYANTLYDSMPDRVTALKQAKGSFTKY